MKRKNLLPVILVAAAVVLFASCARDVAVQHCVTGEPYGFLSGLLHGFISPFSFIASLFKSGYTIYAVNNSGNWYNFGFLLGCSIIFGGGSRAGCR